jgi:uncharacterized Ntn-hydrolase superfamily protein
MTFSIVAVNYKTGEIGFAITSCSWDSGRVGKADPVLGAIVSQARGNMKLRDEFFKIGSENTLAEILDHFRSIDPDIEYRQLGMIKLHGETLSFTGEECGSWAGHKTGKEYACQGNILTGPEVIENMSDMFENTTGDLAEKLLAALIAGDEAGGDRRGKQSARLTVMRNGVNVAGKDTVVNINIEDHIEPVKELARIFRTGQDIYQCWIQLGEIKNLTYQQKVLRLDKLEKHLRKHETSNYHDLWSSLAWKFYELGLNKKAVHAFRKCISISPKTRDNYLEMIKKEELPKEILE